MRCPVSRVVVNCFSSSHERNIYPDLSRRKFRDSHRDASRSAPHQRWRRAPRWRKDDHSWMPLKTKKPARSLLQVAIGCHNRCFQPLSVRFRQIDISCGRDISDNFDCVRREIAVAVSVRTAFDSISLGVAQSNHRNQGNYSQMCYALVMRFASANRSRMNKSLIYGASCNLVARTGIEHVFLI